MVTLRSGRTLERVYLVDAEQYIRYWGVWPEADPGKNSLSMGEVVEVDESPHRLPAALANRVYDAGESGMGFCVFTVVLRDGRKLPYLTGNAVDFPQLPAGVNTSDIADVMPHVPGSSFSDREPHADERDAAYFWCLYRAA
jgi:hypothetical protein